VQGAQRRDCAPKRVADFEAASALDNLPRIHRPSVRSRFGGVFAHDGIEDPWFVTIRKKPPMMFGRVFAMRIDQDVHIRELHQLPARREAFQIVGLEQSGRLVDVVA